MEPLDRAWLAAHPLPEVDESGDKQARGQVFVIGGSTFVPGALALTGEAALRAGAGKLRLATVEPAAMPLGVLMPEASMIALPADEEGEIGPGAVAAIGKQRLARNDALVLGPGMSAGASTAGLVRDILQQLPRETLIVLDAGAMTAAGDLAGEATARGGRIVMTPHHGEMARLAGVAAEDVSADAVGVAQPLARRFNAVIALKGEKTVVIAPDGSHVRFAGGNSGLATSGSGDVLAGLVGGFAARGADPFTAAAWSVFVHGTAGERAAERIAPIGYLARELLPHVPGLVAELSAA